MAEYKISSSATTEQQGKGTAESPFQLQVSTATTAVTAIDLNGCYAKINGTVFISSNDSLFENITAFDGGTLTNESARGWFYGARQLTSFTTNCPNLIDGWGMFGNSNITNLDLSLFPKVQNCYHFIGDNYELTSIEGVLPEATDVRSMISFNSLLKNINLRLPKATDATKMINDMSRTSRNIYLYMPMLTTVDEMFRGVSLPTGKTVTLITNSTIADIVNSGDDSVIWYQSNRSNNATITDYADGLKQIVWQKTSTT